MKRKVQCLNATEMAEAEGIWLRGAACDAGRRGCIASRDCSRDRVSAARNRDRRGSRAGRRREKALIPKWRRRRLRRSERVSLHDCVVTSFVPDVDLALVRSPARSVTRLLARALSLHARRPPPRWQISRFCAAAAANRSAELGLKSPGGREREREREGYCVPGPCRH